MSVLFYPVRRWFAMVSLAVGLALSGLLTGGGQAADPSASEPAPWPLLLLAQQPAVQEPADPPARPESPPVRPPAPAPPDRLETPAQTPTPAPAIRTPRPSAPAARSPIFRLASVPNMLGDSFLPIGQLEIAYSPLNPGNSEVDLPLAGASRRVKIAENNKALPMNRCYFMYHHFHNALEVNPNLGVPDEGSRLGVDRYTIGLEKTFLDDQWSVDVRMPFAGDCGFGAPGFAVQGGGVGNLAVALKRLVLATDTGAVAVGLAIDAPTGSDVTGRIGTTSLVVHNNAVHLSPYVGFLSVPNRRLFYHGFLQIDVPANGNRIDLVPAGLLPPVSATLCEQTLMYLDLSAGCWLYRNRRASSVTGVASLVEFHYATALQDANLATATVDGTGYRFGNLLNRIDVVNLTVGLHAATASGTTVRVGGVFPLNIGPERPFDAELQVSINRPF